MNLQQMKKDKYAVRVAFKETVDEQHFETFEAIDAIHKIGTTSFLINTANPELVRKQLLALTVSENLNIISLQTEGNSLEDVFRALTT